MPALSSTGLLRAAGRLLPAAPGRPLDAALRRAVSTAYFALFTAVGDEVARPYHRETATAARRLVDHGAAREVCSTLVSHKRVNWLPGKPACHSALAHFADCFVRLQAARLYADYDNDYEPTKDAASESIVISRTGIDCLRHARDVRPEQVQAMCVAMIAGPATRRRMTR